MLAYKLVSDRTPRTPFKMAVVLERKTVGHIFSNKADTYLYVPKGSKSCAGEIFDTLEACMESLEA